MMTKEEILDGLKEVLLIVKPKMDTSVVSMDSQLVSDLGIDSFSMLLLVLGTENKFGIEFDQKKQFMTVGEVVDYINDVQK